MIRLPDEIVQQLVKFCEENDYGLAAIANEIGVNVVLIGPKAMPAGLVAVAGAAILLNDVVEAHIKKPAAPVEEPAGPPSSIN